MLAVEVVLQVLLATFGFMGTLINIIVLYALFKLKIGSRSTNILMRSQCAFDALAGFFTFLYKIIGPEIITGLVNLDLFLCIIWYGDSLIWIWVSCGVCNIVCMSMDHAIAVFCPLFYRIHQTLLIGFSLIYVIALSTILFLSNLFDRAFFNGHCQRVQVFNNKALEMFMNAENFLWLIFIYLDPFIIISSTHAAVILYIMQKWKLHKLKSNTKVFRNEEQLWKMYKRTREIALTTVCMASTLLLCHAYDAVTYSLDASGLFDYVLLSVPQQAGLLPIILSTSILPCISAGRIKSLREYILINMIQGFLSKLGLDKALAQPTMDSQGEIR
ncbi:hypothetical protein D915_009564 [Fasciola hepatica]|uniref:G-protein coupled receptors family 1 profile domain-containing protein n=1 Tax=Fasciola hepatica TaxID=6192 RepID=A0A4E0REL5_FASHE|nr:hypothetical protein D915_009564 [Fasciola hepatica]